MKTLLIEAFAGIGGFKQALDLLGYEPMGVIAMDISADCAKVYKQHCRHVVRIQDINQVDEAQVLEWRKRFAKATKVIITRGGLALTIHSSMSIEEEPVQPPVVCLTRSCRSVIG